MTGDLVAAVKVVLEQAINPARFLSGENRLRSNTRVAPSATATPVKSSSTAGEQGSKARFFMILLFTGEAGDLFLTGLDDGRQTGQEYSPDWVWILLIR